MRKGASKERACGDNGLVNVETFHFAKDRNIRMLSGIEEASDVSIDLATLQTQVVRITFASVLPPRFWRRLRARQRPWYGKERIA